MTIYVMLIVFGVLVAKQVFKMINPLNWGIFSIPLTALSVVSYYLLLLNFGLV